MEFINETEAEDAICMAFVNLGDLAGIPCDGTRPYLMDERLIEVCHQCFYAEIYFLGGKGCISAAVSIEQIEHIFFKASAIAIRLNAWVCETEDPKKMKKGAHYLLQILLIHEWLKRTVITKLLEKEI